MTISLITGETLDATLFHLAELKAEGQVRSSTDEAGVMRWMLVDAENERPDMTQLGAQVLTDHGFVPTPQQFKAMGFDAGP